MAIHVLCGSCDVTLKVDDKHAGRRVRCPRCQEIITVPAAQGAAPPVDDEESAFFEDAPSPRPAAKKRSDSGDDAPLLDRTAEPRRGSQAPKTTFQPASRTRPSGMVLHGLYDTFLKSGMELGALIIAGLSFGWFAYMVHRSRDAETG